MNQLVSVIIPTYNRAKFLPEAITSVLGQKLPKNYSLEVIVVDDGSEDDTEKVLSEFSGKIIYKKLPHSGKPATPRNEALRLAKGDIIAFQDSDDVWAEDKLIKQLPIFSNKQIVMSFGNVKTIDQNGRRSNTQHLDEESLLRAEKFENLLSQNSISTLTVMIRASALEKTGFFSEADALRAVEDYELWLRVAASYPNGLKHIPDTLAYYRVHDQNISTTTDLTAVERLCTVLETILDYTHLTAVQKTKTEEVLAAMQENWSRLSNETSPKTRPKISVVMSVYNGEKHLKKAIDGILSQTYKDFEFIIIDDGSTDSTSQILAAYKDKRMRIITQSNHGLVYSLNKGVRLARGIYIARQDADDISLPGRFAKEVKLLERNDHLGLVGTFFTYIDEDSEEPSITICMPTKSLDIKRALYITNPIGHGTAMYRKSVFSRTGYYTNAYGPTEDFELWRRIADTWEMAIIPESMYLYRINKTSISHTKAETQHANTAKIISEQWAKPFYKKSVKQILADGLYYKNMDSPFASLTFDQYAAHQIDIAKALLNTGAIKPGLLTAYAAIRLKPRSYALFIKPVASGVLKFMRIKR